MINNIRPQPYFYKSKPTPLSGCRVPETGHTSTRGRLHKYHQALVQMVIGTSEPPAGTCKTARRHFDKRL